MVYNDKSIPEMAVVVALVTPEKNLRNYKVQQLQGHILVLPADSY